MISLFSSSFNILLNNSSNLCKIYQDYIQNLDLSSITCPNSSCNSSDFSFNTTYNRYVVFSPDHESLSINIVVIRCNKCGTYHALLPSYLFPFHSYTYQFVLATLYLYYCSSTMKANKSKVCEKMNIHRSTLNHWITLISHKDVLDFINQEVSSFLDAIHHRSIDFFDFLKSFFFKQYPFLCHHIHKFFYFSIFSKYCDNCASP